ncbi:hypothetical protein NXS19_001576 [Fusarium pseudograminearum]|nr:hypothetical protein NXS19_001576 [Fusarium pseudograminearum]
MFSSSLRHRKEWAAVIPSLKASSPIWRETTLEACDITFSITASNTTTVDFKVILSSLHELQSQEGKARVERLFLIEGESMSL